MGPTNSHYICHRIDVERSTIIRRPGELDLSPSRTAGFLHARSDCQRVCAPSRPYGPLSLEPTTRSLFRVFAFRFLYGRRVRRGNGAHLVEWRPHRPGGEVLPN